MRNKKGRKGFTLVELIVVIALISIIAAISVPRVNTFVEDAINAKRYSDFNTIYASVVASVSEAVVNEYEYSSDEIIINTSKGNNSPTLLDSISKETMPVDNTLTINEAIILRDTNEVEKNPNADTEDSTWGVLIAIGSNNRIDNIYISNGDYFAINDNEPIKFDSVVK